MAAKVEAVSTPKQECKIVTCTCEHAWQDKTYGKYKRVGNWAIAKSAYRCTVCRKEVK